VSVSDVFAIPLWADLTAVAVGSVQGAAYAAGFRDRRIDLFGVAVIGVVTGLGGGALRDILLGVPLTMLGTDWYLPVAIAAALVGMLLDRVFHRIDWMITALDALTIGLFCAIGTTKALAVGVPAVPAMFVGVIAAVGGGVLRDILLNTRIGVMHVGSLYAVAAGVGAVVLVVSEHLGAPAAAASIACVVVTVAVRLLAVRFGWSLPEQRALSLRRPRFGMPRLRRVSSPAAVPTRTGGVTTRTTPIYHVVDHHDDDPRP
jgi:uncharacterized membrane protein YeiH